MAAGRTRAQVGAMTWTEIEAIFGYWRRYPPANEVLAAVNRAGCFAADFHEEAPDADAGSAPEGCLPIDELRASLQANVELFRTR